MNEHDQHTEFTPEAMPEMTGGPGFNVEYAHAFKGSVRGPGLVFDLFFRTWRFMLSYGVHAKGSTLWAIIWLIGALAVINQLELSYQISGTVNTTYQSWGGLLGLCLIAGIMRGALWYGIGGLWYRARLWMCGVRDAPWEITGRVFVLVRIPEVVAGFVYFGVMMGITDSFQEYLDADAWGFITAALFMMLLNMWTSVMAYNAARGVFFAKRIWALIWFLILPVLVKVFAIAALFVGIYLATVQPKPDLDNTGLHTSELLTVRHPGNWVLSTGEQQSGPVMVVDIEPNGHDAIASVEIEYLGRDADPYETYEPWLTELGFELNEATEPITQWGPHSGIGRAYTASKDGWDYNIRLFFKPISGGAWLSAREIVGVESEDKLKPGFELVRESISFRDPQTIAPDLSDTRTADTGTFRFELPGNWWLQRTIGDAETDDDGNPLPDNFRVTATSLQDSWFEAIAYRSTTTPRAEVGYSLSNLGAPDRLEHERPVDSWLGFDGFGVEGIIRDPIRGDRRIRVLVSPRENGQFVELQQIEYLDTEERSRPGFDLIARTIETDI